MACFARVARGKNVARGKKDAFTQLPSFSTRGDFPKKIQCGLFIIIQVK